MAAASVTSPNRMHHSSSLPFGLFLICITVTLHIESTNAQRLLDGIYCGQHNCYDVLGVTRQSTRSEISKSYRRLAKQYHPDVQRGADAEAREITSELFRRVANAYEILRDDEQRADYDYMLDNPQEYYAHYYRYYRRAVSPKVDVRLVIIVTISIISAIQYYSARQRYEDAIKYFLTVPKYRNKAMEIIQQREKNERNCDGTAAKNSSAKSSGGGGGGKAAKLSKSEQRERSEQHIRNVIMENMDIKGAYAKPSLQDILWVQLLLSPYTLFRYVAWWASWQWRFRLCGLEYGDEEKLYLIRCLLGMGVHQFAAVDEDTKEEYLSMELWQKDRFVEWKREQDEEQAKAMADNPRHKQYRRYMKNHGPGRMTFED